MLAVDQRCVGRCDLRRFHAHPCGLRLHHAQQRQIVFVQQNRRSRKPFQLKCAAHMIDVAVRNQNLLEFQAEFGDPAVDPPHFGAGIDDNGLASLFVPQQSAVAGQRPNGKGL